jgi:hypothetical protein
MPELLLRRALGSSMARRLVRRPSDVRARLEYVDLDVVGTARCRTLLSFERPPVCGWFLEWRATGPRAP